jgi:hypothetical protein
MSNAAAKAFFVWSDADACFSTRWIVRRFSPDAAANSSCDQDRSLRSLTINSAFTFIDDLDRFSDMRGIVGQAGRNPYGFRTQGTRRWYDSLTTACSLPAEGRKVLVLVTESLPLEPGKEGFTAYTDVVAIEAADSERAFGQWTELSNFQP